MSQKIKSAVAVDRKVTEIREFDFPEITPDAGLLRVEVVGVCGSDWPLYKNLKEPQVLGHHTVGHIEKIGAAAAKKWGVKVGDRVALEEYLPCGQCERCKSEDYRLCDFTDPWLNGVRYGFTPVSVNPLLGGYSQYLYLHPNTMLHKMPDHVPAIEAAFTLPLSNGYEWACKEGGVRKGTTVVIQGPGQQGLACVLASKEAEASCIIVTGLTSDQLRLETAQKLGADYTIDIQQENLLERVAEITAGKMADVVIDVSSGGISAVTSAIELANKKGTIVLGGFKHEPIPEFYSDTLIAKYLTVKGVRGHSYESVEKAVEFIASGKYPLHELCTHQFGLNEVDEAIKTNGGEGQPNPILVTVFPWKS
ncbi:MULTISPECIES: zinc-binding dehydrogenase [unclassified Paenibacillus]|uniref:zinc-dependent alcohol dehydrogenase n=1 Tax=unclassified Paenibacillus TaxID=185978 RepID=UPI001AE1DB08|nr:MULTISPECIES: zinc-binding dehydrogenase [unclassified Paenibacillus]MBP1157173.1 threonine dehydrogenase-like Zn-dependent dehydrogenase [Paenibacillus sp. PvP091]MBP1172088.1 threonine dehydrogenase-like Zn-dependent dehydrogenase [Paenibacillus sp. PvR098]MBP2438469.1 threonine dehydrogenase-like Zn-dependent dehydrogenase [Paenibacillus sp. PvP052]